MSLWVELFQSGNAHIGTMFTIRCKYQEFEEGGGDIERCYGPPVYGTVVHDKMFT